ncbi:hypothetical protein H696_01526 [Fonticula alba]|uniref:Uncharacterized protein n=1 Tax=Fonticula alba TaxID=691883 RepID=A0A058ZCI2_FONAL|nr:hypothetical protein H696_01526 [Fonticula alba]KCV72120.1 hypothetical protein H696_01526 [Fonticula alba]|eukprot:XP_009493698.1 hypothetical protein H696_01526 [Fonticula alba]
MLRLARFASGHGGVPSLSSSLRSARVPHRPTEVSRAAFSSLGRGVGVFLQHDRADNAPPSPAAGKVAFPSWSGFRAFASSSATAPSGPRGAQPSIPRNTLFQSYPSLPLYLDSIGDTISDGLPFTPRIILPADDNERGTRIYTDLLSRFQAYRQSGSQDAILRVPSGELPAQATFDQSTLEGGLPAANSLQEAMLYATVNELRAHVAAEHQLRAGNRDLAASAIDLDTFDMEYAQVVGSPKPHSPGELPRAGAEGDRAYPAVVTKSFLLARDLRNYLRLFGQTLDNHSLRVLINSAMDTNVQIWPSTFDYLFFIFQRRSSASDCLRLIEQLVAHNLPLKRSFFLATYSSLLQSGTVVDLSNVISFYLSYRHHPEFPITSDILQHLLLFHATQTGAHINLIKKELNPGDLAKIVEGSSTFGNDHMSLPAELTDAATLAKTSKASLDFLSCIFEDFGKVEASIPRLAFERLLFELCVLRDTRSAFRVYRRLLRHHPSLPETFLPLEWIISSSNEWPLENLDFLIQESASRGVGNILFPLQIRMFTMLSRGDLDGVVATVSFLKLMNMTPTTGTFTKLLTACVEQNRFEYLTPLLELSDFPIFLAQYLAKATYFHRSKFTLTQILETARISYEVSRSQMSRHTGMPPSPRMVPFVPQVKLPRSLRDPHAITDTPFFNSLAASIRRHFPNGLPPQRQVFNSAIFHDNARRAESVTISSKIFPYWPLLALAHASAAAGHPLSAAIRLVELFRWHGVSPVHIFEFLTSIDRSTNGVGTITTLNFLIAKFGNELREALEQHPELDVTHDQIMFRSSAQRSFIPYRSLREAIDVTIKSLTDLEGAMNDPALDPPRKYHVWRRQLAILNYFYNSNSPVVDESLVENLKRMDLEGGGATRVASGGGSAFNTSSSASIPVSAAGGAAAVGSGVTSSLTSNFLLDPKNAPGPKLQRPADSRPQVAVHHRIAEDALQAYLDTEEFLAKNPLRVVRSTPSTTGLVAFLRSRSNSTVFTDDDSAVISDLCNMLMRCSSTLRRILANQSEERANSGSGSFVGINPLFDSFFETPSDSGEGDGLSAGAGMSRRRDSHDSIDHGGMSAHEEDMIDIDMSFDDHDGVNPANSSSVFQPSK